MFTGIVTDIGTIRSIEHRGDLRVVVECSYDPETIDIGASIACSGVCLTVIDKGRDTGGNWFAVDVSGETQSCTAQGQWSEGRRLNLERALKVGDELGGHIVTGHVDGIGERNEAQHGKRRRGPAEADRKRGADKGNDQVFDPKLRDHKDDDNKEHGSHEKARANR